MSGDQDLCLHGGAHFRGRQAEVCGEGDERRPEARHKVGTGSVYVFIPLWSQNIRQTSSRGVSVFGFKEEEGVGEDDGGQLEPVQEDVGGGGATEHGPCQGGEAEKKKLKYIVFILGRLGRMRKQILTMVWRRLISQSH